MNKKRFEIVEELDPASVSGVPDVHKKHYEKLGYRPYRMGDGKVKWLTEGEKAYNKTRGMPDPKRRSKKKFHASDGRLRRKRRDKKTLWTFISEYWVFPVMAAITVIVLLICLR